MTVIFRENMYLYKKPNSDIMKRFPVITLFAAIACISILASCNKNGAETEEDYALDLRFSDINTSGFNIVFTSGSDVSTVEYAVCSFATMKSDMAAFESGTLEGTVSLPIENAETTVNIPCDSYGPYVVYARAVSMNGVTGETLRKNVAAAEAGVTISSFNSIIMDMKVEISNSDRYGSAGVLIASKEIVDEQLGMPMEELLKMYVEMGEVQFFENGVEFVAPLNGESEYDYYIGIVTADKEGNPVDYFTIPFQSPKFNPDAAAPGSLKIEVKDITDNGVTTVYTFGENTVACYQAIYSKTDYDKLIAAAPGFDYKNPIDYVRDYTAFYGTMIVADETYTWPGFTAGTDYVAVGCPMNENGIEGYGETVTVEFRTTGTAPAAAAPASASKPYCKAICSIEQVKEVIGR